MNILCVAMGHQVFNTLIRAMISEMIVFDEIC